MDQGPQGGGESYLERSTRPYLLTKEAVAALEDGLCNVTLLGAQGAREEQLGGRQSDDQAGECGEDSATVQRGVCRLTPPRIPMLFYLGHGHHSIKWSSDFVAHVCQKHRFGLHRSFRNSLGSNSPPLLLLNDRRTSVRLDMHRVSMGRKVQFRVLD